jgi:hypothetical protein
MKDYATTYSECCDETLHRPGNDGPWFCMGCGKSYPADSAESNRPSEPRKGSKGQRR